MENIKIIKITSKTTKPPGNKPYKMCEVEVNGEIRKVNIWSNAPNFANLVEGSVIVANMVMDGNYWNVVFENQSTPRASGGFKTAQAKEVIDYKQTGIAKSQDNKELSIKTASTMRMAVDIAIALTPEQREGTMQETIRWWREWCWLEWDKTGSDAMPPF